MFFIKTDYINSIQAMKSKRVKWAKYGHGHGIDEKCVQKFGL